MRLKSRICRASALCNLVAWAAKISLPAAVRNTGAIAEHPIARDARGHHQLSGGGPGGLEVTTVAGADDLQVPRRGVVHPDERARAGVPEGLRKNDQIP